MAGPKLRLFIVSRISGLQTGSSSNFWGELQQTDQTLDLERPQLVSKVFFLYEMMTTASDVSFKNIFLPAQRSSLDIMVLANSYNDLSQIIFRFISSIAVQEYLH